MGTVYLLKIQQTLINLFVARFPMDMQHCAENVFIKSTIL